MTLENTSSNFQIDNPVLDIGEIGIETDTGRSKVGDGVTAWNNLPYSSLVTASRFNLLQARLEQVLGTGSGQTGYGQGLPGYGSAVSSYPVSSLSDSNTVIISASDMNAIYSDMLRIRVHQVGTEPSEIAELLAEINNVALNNSSQVSDTGVITPDPEGSKKGIVDYENLMDAIEQDKFLMDSSQATIETAGTDSRSTPWNGSIYYEFTVSFNNEDHRRHFFNTGGEIYIKPSLENTGANAKSEDWKQLLINLGTIIFSHDTTIGPGSNPIGNYSLDGTYKTICLKTRTSGGIYEGNLVRIEARLKSDNQIQFKVTFDDAAPSLNFDANVTGNLKVSVQYKRADSFYISVPKPTLTRDVSLSIFNAPEPIYQLSANPPGVQEGESVIITLSTVNVAPGDLVEYVIQGVTQADISGESLEGTFTVGLDGTDTLKIDIANDTILKDQDSETMTVRLRNGSSLVRVNITDSTPNPTYSLTAVNSSAYEGFTATFDLSAQNIQPGTQIPYTISGITSADIDGRSLIGIFEPDSQGNARLILPLTIDNFEETETLTVTLDNLNISASTEIKDATYTLYSNNSAPKEGDTVTITLITKELPEGTTVPYTITGVSANDIDIPLTGEFTVVNNRAQKLVKFNVDAEVEPSERFRLALDNGRASIEFDINDTPLPTSATRTCIAVIDEASSPSQTTMDNSWSQFRANWPNRPFYLLQPLQSRYPRSTLKEPVDFVNDPLTNYAVVNRDNGNTSQASDWFTICELDKLPNGSDIALFLDISGSMDLADVRASYDLFKTKLQEKNMNIIETEDKNENWILPFDIILDSNKATYSISPNRIVTEGNTATFTVNTTNAPDSITLYWTIEFASTADFGAISGSFVHNNNTPSTISIPVINDNFTEGDENFTISLRAGSTSGPVLDTATLTVRDQPSPIEFIQNIDLLNNIQYSSLNQPVQPGDLIITFYGSLNNLNQPDPANNVTPLNGQIEIEKAVINRTVLAAWYHIVGSESGISYDDRYNSGSFVHHHYRGDFTNLTKQSSQTALNNTSFTVSNNTSFPADALLINASFGQGVGTASDTNFSKKYDSLLYSSFTGYDLNNDGFLRLTTTSPGVFLGALFTI